MFGAAARKLQAKSEPVGGDPDPSIPQGSADESAEGIPSWEQIKTMRDEAKASRGMNPDDEPMEDPMAMADPDELEFRKFAEEFSAGGLGEEAQSSLAAERSALPDFLPPGVKQLMQKYSVMNQQPMPPMPPGPGGPKPPGM